MATPKPKDITGMKFNRLKALQYVETKYNGRQTYWLFRCDCEKEKILSKSSVIAGKTKSCGCLKKELDKTFRGKRLLGASNPKWKGGRRKNKKSGYVFITPQTGMRGIPEHRLVMEEHIKRPLLKYETVHHKNGIRDDNRLENLELWSSPQPFGQRATDLVKFARQVLQIYGDLFPE